MSAPQPAPAAAYNDAVAKLADAMASELTDLQTALPPLTTPEAVETAVTNLNNLVGELKQAVTGASGSPPKGATVVPQSEPGHIATPGTLPLTSPLTPPAPIVSAPVEPAHT